MLSVKSEYKKVCSEYSAKAQEIVDLDNQKVAATRELYDLGIKKRDAGLFYYSGEKRRTLFKKAKNTPFSKDDLAVLKYFCDDRHWNQDEVTNDVLAVYERAEAFIRPSAGARFVRFLEDCGRLTTDFSEEDIANDN